MIKPTKFLWGAATAPHQVEGNNVNNDFWAKELTTPGMQRSGDAVDSYHRFRDDMDVLAAAGLTAYRFGVEWSRIEPAPGAFSRAELAHYRRMIDAARERGLTPVVTLHHFTNPRWFADDTEGWFGDGAIERFASYVTAVSSILEDVEYVCTINEPNMFALMGLDIAMPAEAAEDWSSPTVNTESAVGMVLPEPDPIIGRRLMDAHAAATEILHARTGAQVGWTIAAQALTASPVHEEKLREVYSTREDPFLIASRGDDFVGVQAYTSNVVDENGIVPNPPRPDDTLAGLAYRPEALGIAVRHAWDVTQGTPVIVTENGIATADDERRIAYTKGALQGLNAAIADGIDVRGYLHWSALDNYEWGHWEPTFGLIAADRTTFERTPKPSLAWLGEIARGTRTVD